MLSNGQNSDEHKSVRIFSYLSFILVGIVNTFLGPILPFLTEKWTINDTQAGYFLAAQSLGGMGGTIASSFLFSRLSSRLILLIGFAIIALSLLGISSNVWEIGFVSSLFSGVAIGLIIPTTTLIVSQTAKENRAAVINILNFFWAFGAILSPLLFFNLDSKTRLNFLLIALTLACAIFFAILVKRRNASFNLKTLNSPTNRKPETRNQKPLLKWTGKLYLLGSAWLFATTIFLQIGVEASLGGWLATYSKRLTVSDWWLLVPALYWTGFLLSRVVSTFYLRRFSEKSLILNGLSLVIFGQILIISASEINLAAVGATLVGFGTAPIFPTVIAIVSTKFENKAPELISYMFLLAGLSGMIFSWLIGFTASASGNLKNALFIPLLCSVILFALHFFTRNTVSTET
ncbi:MAG: MFS transporter [Acidobacteriota bacterium]|nr:MFS transporter [Acidobacteriota bacterium]